MASESMRFRGLIIIMIKINMAESQNYRYVCLLSVLITTATKEEMSVSRIKSKTVYGAGPSPRRSLFR